MNLSFLFCEQAACPHLISMHALKSLRSQQGGEEVLADMDRFC
jgi:hypothetical protein